MGKSQIKSQSQIKNHLTKRFKSSCQITNRIPKSQITLTKITNQITIFQSNEKVPDLTNWMHLPMINKNIQFKKFSSNSPSHYTHTCKSLQRLEMALVPKYYTAVKHHKVVIIRWRKFINHKSNHINWNQIQIKPRFQIKSFVVKSNPHMIQSWFKSNHDLYLPITARYMHICLSTVPFYSAIIQWLSLEK